MPDNLFLDERHFEFYLVGAWMFLHFQKCSRALLWGTVKPLTNGLILSGLTFNTCWAGQEQWSVWGLSHLWRQEPAEYSAQLLMSQAGFWSGWWKQGLSQPCVSTRLCFLILLVVDSFLRQISKPIGTQPNIWGRSLVDLWGCLSTRLYAVPSPAMRTLMTSSRLLALSFTWGCWRVPASSLSGS